MGGILVGWVHGWIYIHPSGCVSGWMALGGQTDGVVELAGGQVYRQVDRGVYRQTGGWTVEWTSGWIGGLFGQMVGRLGRWSFGLAGLMGSWTDGFRWPAEWMDGLVSVQCTDGGMNEGMEKSVGCLVRQVG